MASDSESAAIQVQAPSPSQACQVAAQHYCHDHNRKASKTNERIHLLPEHNLVNLFVSDGHRRTGEQGITRDKCSQKGSPDLKNLKQKISGSNLVYGCSHTGNRTPVCWVKTSYPDR